MDRDFEPFRGGPNEALSKRLHVTICRQLIIKLNRNTYELLGRPAAVRLSYSHQRDAIGLEAASPRLNDAFPLIRHCTGFRINAAPFCRHFNISPDATWKFIAPEIKGETMVLNLRETITVSRGKLPRKGKTN